MINKHIPSVHTERFLETKDGHKVWYGESGNPEGIPVVSLHGGPGSQSKPKHLKRLINGNLRIIQIDQRGCGKSLPLGSIENNTTDHLIEDMEAIRKELGIDKWIITTGSWGSVLALVYAERYPEHVSSILLRSVILLRKEDNDWVMGEKGVARIYPDLHEYRLEACEENGIDIDNYSEEITRMLMSDSFEKQQIAASIQGNWEGNMMVLESDFNIIPSEFITEEMVSSIKIFMHYESNGYFLEDNQILNKIDKIKDIPVRILHARYDVLCPLEQAYLLNKKLNNSKLFISDYSSHKLSAETQQVADMYLEELINIELKRE